MGKLIIAFAIVFTLLIAFSVWVIAL